MIKTESGYTVITGKDIDVYRLLVLKGGLRMECMGMKKHGQSAYSIVKKEFGFKGTKESVLKQLIEYINKVTSETPFTIVP